MLRRLYADGVPLRTHPAPRGSQLTHGEQTTSHANCEAEGPVGNCPSRRASASGRLTSVSSTTGARSLRPARPMMRCLTGPRGDGCCSRAWSAPRSASVSRCRAGHWCQTAAQVVVAQRPATSHRERSRRRACPEVPRRRTRPAGRPQPPSTRRRRRRARAAALTRRDRQQTSAMAHSAAPCPANRPSLQRPRSPSTAPASRAPTASLRSADRRRSLGLLGAVECPWSDALVDLADGRFGCPAAARR